MSWYILLIGYTGAAFTMGHGNLVCDQDCWELNALQFKVMQEVLPSETNIA
jgi:hypothetical protein